MNSFAGHSLPLLATLSLAVACGPLPADVELQYVIGHEEAIINGHPCAADELGNAVVILIDADIDFFGMAENMKTTLCTGTLIAPDVVLAAAHCFDSEALTMGFGTVTREAYYASFTHDLVALAEQSSTTFPDDAIEAVDWAVHPQFSLDSFENVAGPGDYKDVALMFLSEAVTHVEPELVITAAEASQMVEGKEVQIAGWGQQTATASPMDPPPPGTVGAKHCGTSFISEIGAMEMQVGGDASTTRKCHGDSGGPSYMEVDTSHTRSRRVVGITSHAYDETDCAKGGVDTRVDVWLDWIDSEMRSACGDGTRVWCEVDGIIPPSYYDPGGQDPNTPGSGGDGGDDLLGGGCLDCAATRAGAGPATATTLLAPLALLALARRRARAARNQAGRPR